MKDLVEYLSTSDAPVTLVYSKIASLRLLDGNRIGAWFLANFVNDPRPNTVEGIVSIESEPGEGEEYVLSVEIEVGTFEIGLGSLEAILTPVSYAGLIDKAFQYGRGSQPDPIEKPAGWGAFG